jgi:Ca-activated chloride channel family protein
MSVLDTIKLGRPDLLWLLWVVGFAALFQLWAFRRKQVLLERFVTPELLERIAIGVSRPRQVFKTLLVLFALLLLVVSLAEFKLGYTWEDVEREGVDVLVALDVSDSMLVEDAEAGGGLSRLERAKREITDLLQLMSGDRIGLVAFAGTAFTECPLTLDYGAASLFLDNLSTDLIPVKGTSISQAIRTSLKAFEAGSHESKAIILITDGEDHSGEALAAAAEAKVQGVRIFAIGIGRDEGSPIPNPSGGYRRDRRGNMILSKLDEPTLQKIALETGGRYVRSVTGDVDLEKVYLQGIKATLTDKTLTSSRRQRWKDRFQWLVGLALLLLMLEPLVPERRQRKAHV